MTRSRGKPSARIGRRPSTSKEELAAIGIELFMEAGFDETSIDDIAEAADIARRTFFRYFPSKNEVAWGTSTNTSPACARASNRSPRTFRSRKR